MKNLKDAISSYTPGSEEQTQSFLNQYSDKVQLQFVSALYHGRTHFHANSFSIDGEDPSKIGTLNADHIKQNEYARLISEKGDNVLTYLNKFEECARASNFDINDL